MTFETLGNIGSPAVVLIHGMLCTAKDCVPFGKYLADEYFVIMPTLDGHGRDGTELVSADEEARKIADYLAENGIKRLALLQGSSMGAEVALAVLAELETRGIEVGCTFFDGGPFFDFIPPKRKMMYKVFRKLTRAFDTDDPEKAADELMNNGFLKFVGGKRTEQFRPMIESMASERRTFSDTTVQGMVDVCYHCALPIFGWETQRRMVFFFSKEEPARKSMARLMKAYPKAKYRAIAGYPHCGLQVNKPRVYAELLGFFINEINSCKGMI
ncbi:MAG: alpha/beta hydrolase [Ruminococcus sp.]|nr:alpha/beta hydrolase [Ruminococcus sp.]